MTALDQPGAHTTNGFWSEAETALVNIWSTWAGRLREIVETADAAWHPGGFMTFTMPIAFPSANVRLHVWPANERNALYQRTPGTGVLHDGEIHNHVWRIVSFCLAGYQDSIVDLDPDADAHPVLGGPYQTFEVEYLSASDQLFAPVGERTGVTEAAARRIRPGTIHRIEAGVLHAPTVPDDVEAATLVLRSAPVVEGRPLALFRSDPGPGIVRSTVTSANRRTARGVIERAVASLGRASSESP